MHTSEIATPALIVEVDALDANIARMGARWPGTSLRPHVKAFKSTALAHRLARAGHHSFCCATVREMAGMARAGLGRDLLLANEVVDVGRLTTLVRDAGDARLTVAVDSSETIAVAARAGVAEVLVDVAVGMPRCGCDPSQAAALADEARRLGLTVRGVMGYEGHLMVDAVDRAGKVAESMVLLTRAHDAVGGEVVSGGGTGTWEVNVAVTELQAGSYALMDTHYAAAGVGFAQALFVQATVISVSASGGYAVADAGLKALGMDHGPPAIDDASVWFCSDEHTTYAPRRGVGLPTVGDKVLIRPAHVDPTVAYHDLLWLVRGEEILDTWPVDLRGW